MKAYVINLARSPERRAHMVRELRRAGTDYEFVEGVEGSDLDVSDPHLVDPKWLGRSPFWPGAAGCYLSHHKVYKRVLESGIEQALVLEDDVVLPIDMMALVQAASTLTTGAEAILFQYFSCTSAERGEACKFNKQDSAQLPSERVLALPINIGDIGGSGAYLITHDACARMVKTMLPMKVPIDNWDFFYNEGAIDRLRCVIPAPVGINPGFRTTIDHYERDTFQTRLREVVIKIPLVNKALTIRRQRIMMRKTRIELIDGS